MKEERPVREFQDKLPDSGIGFESLSSQIEYPKGKAPRPWYFSPAFLAPACSLLLVSGFVLAIGFGSGLFGGYGNPQEELRLFDGTYAYEGDDGFFEYGDTIVIGAREGDCTLPEGGYVVFGFDHDEDSATLINVGEYALDFEFSRSGIVYGLSLSQTDEDFLPVSVVQEGNLLYSGDFIKV